MKLYTYPLAFNPPKAKLMLLEKGIPHQSQIIDLFNGNSLAPEFIRLSPSATVPALQLDDGRMITESREIAEYVDNLNGAPLGGSAVDRALAAEWVKKIDAWDGNLFMAANGPAAIANTLGALQEYKIKVAEARAKSHPDLAATYQKKIDGIKKGGLEGQDTAVVAKNRSDFVALLDGAEAQLGSTPYLAGQEYSIADALFTPILFRIGAVGKNAEYLDPRPRVKEYYGRLKQRPSFQETFGPALSKFTAAAYLLPALLKAKFANLTGRY